MRAMAAMLLAVAFVPSAALAHSHKKNSLEVVHPWTPAMVEERKIVNVAVYMKVKNAGKSAERLLSATTPLAEKVELIELKDQGSTKLPTAASALTIPAGGSLEMSPDGPRLLLSGFKKKLDAYDSFELTLEFEKAGQLVVEVVVEEAVAAPTHKH
jgi:periplasmic copper chaperone A